MLSGGYLPPSCSQVCYTQVMLSGVLYPCYALSGVYTQVCLSLWFIPRYASQCGLFSACHTCGLFSSCHTCGLYLLVHLWVIPPCAPVGYSRLINSVGYSRLINNGEISPVHGLRAVGAERVLIMVRTLLGVDHGNINGAHTARC